MLCKILRLTAERGGIRCKDLARALDTSPDIVRLALADLVRRDYLQAVPGCSCVCENCLLRAACHYRRQPQVWMLTRKGEAWTREQYEKTEGQ